MIKDIALPLCFLKLLYQMSSAAEVASFIEKALGV